MGFLLVVFFAVLMIVPLFRRNSENFQLRGWLLVTYVLVIGLVAFIVLGLGGLAVRIFSN
jgi:hypothetical protein